MKRMTSAAVACLGIMATAIVWHGAHITYGIDAAGQAAARQIPRFQVDPKWPQLPNNWVLGLTSGITVAPDDDHIWIIHRPRTVKPEQVGHAAPPVLEFDASGKFLRGWGGPGAGYEWFETEHGISVDYKGFVWVDGSAEKDAQILKFTKDGKFVMQIGHFGQSKGNADTDNVHGAADMSVNPRTNEVFVADGYFNRRIIVFDADTGKFKRMWGAFGNVATDPPPAAGGRGRGAARAEDETGQGSDQFNRVHSVRISNDDLVYVADRANKRFQIFTPQGKFVTQVFVSRKKAPPSTLTGIANGGKPLNELADGLVAAGETASRTAFSPDKAQQFLYVIDRSRQQIAIFDRKSLELLGYAGDGPGQKPGQFYVLHDIAVDSKGNIYTAEVIETGNRRAQKLEFKGMTAAKPLTN